jgi:hypothetical protein
VLHRRSFSRVATLLVALLAFGALAATSVAARPGKHQEEKRGGKKPLGKIVSFDSSTMLLTLVDKEGVEHTGTVAADAKVKVRHRGEHDATEEHTSPSNGTLDDLVPGALVLKMKRDEDVIVGIRLAPPRAEEPAEEPISDETDEDAGDEGDGDDGSKSEA